MRTGTVNIHGKEYMICFSTRVIVRIEEKYGDYTKGLESILSGGKASDVFWLLAEMIEAGSRYARMEGMADAGTLLQCPERQLPQGRTQDGNAARKSDSRERVCEESRRRVRRAGYAGRQGRPQQ